jgi:malonyl-CoA/methylmalonyl-CoA synthetase
MRLTLAGSKFKEARAMTESSRESRSDQSGHFLDELRTTIAARANHEAVCFPERSFTYGDLDAEARAWARALHDCGVEPGDRVAIITPEKPAFVSAHLGTLYAGGVSLPLNPRFTREELRFLLADSGARVVVASPEQYLAVESLRPELPEIHAVLPDTAPAGTPQDFPFEPALGASAPCLMLYSSGTTGRPKGVVHTHANLSSSLRALQRCWRFTPDDVLVNVLPLFHIHGLSFAMHLSLLTGSRMIVADSFHPRHTLELIERGTVFMAIPTFYYSFLDRPEFTLAARKWGHVRLFTCGSAPIRPEVLPELEQTLGRPVINRYGMTEAHVITSLPVDGPWPTGSVGLPLEGIEVRVLTDSGSLASPGEVGSVQLRGPNLFREYWRKPEATREAFASGWFDAGDLGSRDDCGFLTLVGRKNDLIITNGFNVYPQVVERVINACPGVRESIVVGVPDKKRGERVMAAVVRTDDTLTPQAVRVFLGDRLVDYQRPAEIVFVTDLPRNPTGKVLRRELRDQLSTSAD